MTGINYEDLELRALAHMLPYCPDLLNTEEGAPWDSAPPLRMGPQRCLSSRETIERLSTAVPGILPAEPYQVERTLKRAATHWRDIFARYFPEAARYFPEAARYFPDAARYFPEAARYFPDAARYFPEAARYFPEHSKPRHVWMGGDAIDDGSHKATPEEAAECWRQVRKVIVEASKRYPMDPESARLLREETLYGSQTYYPPHTRDRGARG